MKTDQCEMNTSQLLAYLETPTRHPATEAHLETCPLCRSRLERLSQAVLSQQTDRLTCGECQANLPDYFQTQVEGRDPAGLFAEVRDHLALCLHCQRLYRDLLEFDKLISTGDLPEPATYSPPDLFFLKRIWGPERFGKIVRHGAYWAQAQTRDLVVAMRVFFQVLGRRPFPDLVVRGEAYELREVLYQIALGPENLDDLDVEVTAYRQLKRPEVARVVVHVRVPSRLLTGFAGGEVQMKTEAMARGARTDDDGLVIFEDVPLADLKEATFTIIPP